MRRVDLYGFVIWIKMVNIGIKVIVIMMIIIRVIVVVKEKERNIIIYLSIIKED